MRVHRRGGGLCLGGGNFSRDAQLPAGDEFVDAGMILNVLVQLGHQRALAVPFVRANDVHAIRGERIRRAHHGTDVEIVRPVFDGDFEAVATGRVQIVANGVHSPVPVTVEHVATIAFIQQRRIVASIVVRRFRVIRAWLTGVLLRPWSYADFTKFRLPRSLCRQRDGVGLVHGYRSSDSW